MRLPFPKPKDAKKLKPVAVFVLEGGREVCNMKTCEGQDEYKRRIGDMWMRQKGRCCLENIIGGCPGQLALQDATFEHQDGRGMGGAHRDDRIEIDGKPINGSSHSRCNFIKGSRRINYNGEKHAS